MAHKYLTISDYKRWQFCPTSTFHGWQKCPSKSEGDGFLKYLAKEGKGVGQLARRLFADGRLIDEPNSARANSITRRALKFDSATLFEACIIRGDYVTRPDILIRKGNTLYVVEVKSKLGKLRWHQEGKMLINMYGDVRAGYRGIVHDLAFQTVILQRAFPQYTVVPYFLLPEETTQAGEQEVAMSQTTLESCIENSDECSVKQRRKHSILKFFDATEAIHGIVEEVSLSMDSMAAAWHSGQRPEPTLKYRCRNCEFRLKDGRKKDDGFHQCWGALADPDPHLFSLYQLYSLKQADNKQALLADQKITEGKTSLFDVSETELHGEHQNRQRIQLRCQRTGEEWIDPRLGEAIDNLEWPIVFVDFETILMTVPWYSGTRPGQVLPFQFSAHILHRDGRMVHREWLNVKDEIPTLKFIRKLKSALKGVGSVLVYTDYENRILKEAFEFLRRYGKEAKEERAWIHELLHSGRIIDQHQWVYDWYSHPDMNRTSIKVVLPAVWQNNPSLHRHPHFKKYYKAEDGQIVDPYKTLPEAIIDGQPFPVREGTGAMQGYREMIKGKGASCPKSKEAIADMLRNYVTLDTASQWIIFEHWRARLAGALKSSEFLPVDVL